MDMENILNDFINSKSKFFSLPDGEKATVKYLGGGPKETDFKGTRVNSIRYIFEVDGKEMVWDRSSREFAIQMKQFKIGDTITIKRTGKGNQTKYEITKRG